MSAKRIVPVESRVGIEEDGGTGVATGPPGGDVGDGGGVGIGEGGAGGTVGVAVGVTPAPETTTTPFIAVPPERGGPGSSTGNSPAS